MNIIQICGHLGADPDIRFTSDGKKVITIRVAINVRKGGKDETVWYRVTLWDDHGRWEKMVSYLKKGSAVIVVGELGKPEIYNDKEGRPQVSLEIRAEFIRFSPFGKPDGARQEGQPMQAQQGMPSQQRGGHVEQRSFEQQQQPFAANTTQYFSGQAAAQQHHAEEEPIPF